MGSQPTQYMADAGYEGRRGTGAGRVEFTALRGSLINHFA